MTTKYQTNLKAYNHDQQYNIWKLVLNDCTSVSQGLSGSIEAWSALALDVLPLLHYTYTTWTSKQQYNVLLSRR